MNAFIEETEKRHVELAAGKKRSYSRKGAKLQPRVCLIVVGGH